MIVAAVDPGLTTGLASYETAYDLVLGTKETTDPVEVGWYLDWLRDTAEADGDDVVVVVENYLGAGPRTAEATHTLQVLGFVRWYAAMLGLPVVVQAPQQRLAYVTRATELAPKLRHAGAALAHALAYAAKQKPY